MQPLRPHLRQRIGMKKPSYFCSVDKSGFLLLSLPAYGILSSIDRVLRGRKEWRCSPLNLKTGSSCGISIKSICMRWQTSMMTRWIRWATWIMDNLMPTSRTRSAKRSFCLTRSKYLWVLPWSTHIPIWTRSRIMCWQNLQFFQCIGENILRKKQRKWYLNGSKAVGKSNTMKRTSLQKRCGTRKLNNTSPKWPA